MQGLWEGVTKGYIPAIISPMISRESIEKRSRQGRRACSQWHYDEAETTPRAIGKYGSTRVPCSCWMCGNLRRTGKGAKRLTLQERRADLPD